MNAREIRLASRPRGEPVESDFALAQVAVGEPGPGQVLVRNVWMSVDPYMRGRMNDVKSYAPPFALGVAMNGGAVGEVVATRAEHLPVGAYVLHGLGWRDYAVLDAAGAQRVDPDVAPLPAYLGVLGMPGLTAYAGLVEVAGLRDGDVVFVSGAAGAVGSVAGQIARLRGHRVIGSAGSAAKVAHLRDELGFDEAFNYRDAPVRDLLTEAAPEGIDVYFDNVGGEHLEAAIGALRVHGRVAVCGAISQYNATEPPPGPRNLALLIGRRLTVRGFLVSDHAHLRADFEREVGAAYAEGRLRAAETVVEGLERAPEAFLGLLRGANTGKMLVRLG
ncbi:MAG TPA: NADP-dependent oxidoreductase [Mycobacteriales bacterium]|nr:NADP-dependent oxidoreductase [Mycobacteriales bacterium]